MYTGKDIDTDRQTQAHTRTQTHIYMNMQIYTFLLAGRPGFVSACLPSFMYSCIHA